MPVAEAFRALRVAAVSGVERGYMDTESLDNILNGTTSEPAEAIEPEAQAPEEVEQPTDARPRDEHGRFVPKGETTEAPAPVESASPAPKVEEPALEHPALLGERKRRQEAEREREELRQRLAALEAEPPAPLTSVFEDEDGFAQQIRKLAVQEALQQITPQMQQQQRAMLIEMKRETYRAKHDDFTAIEAELFVEMEKNPALAQKVMTAEDPVEFGYRYMKNAKQVEELGTLNLEEIKAKIREELQAEALAGVQASLSRPTAPPTLSGERNVGTRSGPEWAGPKSLGSILSS